MLLFRHIKENEDGMEKNHHKSDRYSSLDFAYAILSEMKTKTLHTHSHTLHIVMNSNFFSNFIYIFCQSFMAI